MPKPLPPLPHDLAARAHAATAAVHGTGAWSLDPATGGAVRTELADVPVEFPRIDDRLLGSPHPVAAAATDTGRDKPHPGCWDALAFHDTHSGTLTTWAPEDTALGEPVFAPPGYWLALGTRFSTDRSHLYVLPSDDPASGPVATIELPVRVPLGLHGSWLPGDEGSS